MRRARLALALSPVAFLVACGSAGTTTGGTGGDGGGPPRGPTANVEVPDNRFFLRLDDEAPPLVTLALDKATALELFGDDAARQITLLEVDSTALLENAVEAIRSACDFPSPNCAPGSPEKALVQLLGMTPATADVEGTSLQDFAHLFSQNPDIFDEKKVSLPIILQESLGLPQTNSPVIPTQGITAVLQDQLLGTHPAIGPSGKLTITLYDALNDLRTLPEKLGPAGDHPGVLVPDDPSFVTRSDALGPDFEMRVVAQSNLRLVEGVELARGAGEMFVSVAGAPLSFDFEDPVRTSISGVAPNPTIDMRIKIREAPTWVPACAGTDVCKLNLPMAPAWAGGLWSVAPWTLESIVARVAYDAYANRSFEKCYLTLNQSCLVGVEIGSGGDPPGWTRFISDFQSVTVPPETYLWELLAEVAQVRLHDTNGDGMADVAEGQAEPTFALTGLGIGLTGDELVAALRPNLQAQAEAIANGIAGGYWKNNDALDFFYQRAPAGGPPLLVFVADGDLAPDPADPGSPRPYTYDRPGFFAQPDLDDASRVSSTKIAGSPDTTHEKYRLPAGDTTLYAQDPQRRVYRLDFHAPEGDPVEIAVTVSPL